MAFISLPNHGSKRRSKQNSQNLMLNYTDYRRTLGTAQQPRVEFAQAASWAAYTVTEVCIVACHFKNSRVSHVAADCKTVKRTPGLQWRNVHSNFRQNRSTGSKWGIRTVWCLINLLVLLLGTERRLKYTIKYINERMRWCILFFQLSQPL
jgi:hypothetical protein